MMTKIMIMVTTENNDYQKDKKSTGKRRLDQDHDKKLGGDGGCDNIDNDIDEEEEEEEVE